MCLVARILEAAGIPTTCLGSAHDILSAGRPPRATFVDYPLGHSSGRPFDPADQYAVVRAAVSGLEAMSTAGEIVLLPNRWAATEEWKAGAMSDRGGDSRQPRDETPQFQFPADRDAALASGALRG